MAESGWDFTDRSLRHWPTVSGVSDPQNFGVWSPALSDTGDFSFTDEVKMILFTTDVQFVVATVLHRFGSRGFITKLFYLP